MSITVDRIINQGTDYEFSISESVADLITHGKFIESELSAYMTCGYIDNRVQGIVTPNLSLSQMGDYIDSCMFVPSAVTGFSADYSWNKQFPSNFQYYKRNLLVYSEAGINNGQYLTNQDYTKWYIVLDIDIKKFYLKDNFRVSDTIAGFTYTDSNGESIEVYGSYNNTEYQCLWQDDNTATNLFVIGLSIINGKMYFYMDNPHNQAYPKPLNSCAIWYDGGIKGGTGGEFITDVTGTVDLSFMPVLDGLPDYTNGQNNQTPSQEYISGYTNSNGELFGLNKSGHGSAYYDATSIAVRDNQIGARITKGMRLAEIFAWAGFKFKFKNTWYKPIISGGIVTGYTDDMSQESEWDDMTNVTGNTVPVTPPVPPIPDNPFDVDAEAYGWGGNEVGGMVRYYLLTSTEMDNLVSAMGSSANWVIDYLNNIVSCFIVPNDGIFFDAAIATTVKFRVDNNNEWDTGVSCKRISGVVNKSGGTIEIPRCTNSFLDFEPYSDYSIYIPFCGRVPIKGNIVCGREITVTYYPDVPTCSLTAVVTCGGSTVAIAKGQYGSMIPVTSSGADRKTAAAISDVSSIITGIGVGIAGAATGNAGLLIAGGSELVGGLLNTAKDSVQSYAYSSGSSGDTSFFAAGTRCQYYANYLQLDDVVNTSEFGHTIGYLCKEIGKLSNYHGFTICANPHIHISATSTEKEEIKQLLEQGVILP